MKTVLITGISRGIGKEISKKFSAKGWNICGCYKTNKPDFKLPNSLFLQADISNHKEVKELFKKALDKYGKIDCVINNAGITADKTILKMSDKEWESVINTNLNGVFYVLKEAMAAMKKEKQGSIINISSRAAFKSNIGCSNYSASKAGVIALTRTAAREAGRFGISVNAVFPGFHFTDMGKRAGDNYITQVKEESVLNTTTNIAELTDFLLLLSEMKTVSGQIFNIDSRIN